MSHWDAGEERLSGRERKRVERAGALLAGLLRIWGGSWRLREDKAALDALRAQSPSGALIFVFWHNRVLMLSYTHRGQNVQVLRSGSRDGQLIAAANRRLGYGMPAGSGSRGGASGLRKLVLSARAGLDTGITVDGPRGPRGHFHGGALHLAALSGCPLVPVTISSPSMKRFGTWDRTLLPWPFARVDLRYGEAVRVPRNADAAAMEALRKQFEARLQSFSDRHDLAMGADPIDPEGVFKADYRSSWARIPELGNPLLTPLGWLFGLIARFVGLCRDARKHRCRKPVISVGNLEVGGTGKTPTVIALARLLLDAGFRPGIVTGLWGRDARTLKSIRSDEPHFDQRSLDEARLMAKQLPNVPVLAARRKWQGAVALDDDPAVDLILVDDGFQHRRLARGLDLVLLSRGCRLSAHRLLPAGPLREFPSALKRADVCVLEAGSGAPPTWTAPVIETERVIEGLRELDGSEGPVRAGGYIAVSAIARPARFEIDAGAMLREMSGRLLGLIRFDDHADWSPRIRGRLAAARRDNPDACFLLTEKDALRWAPHWDLPGPAPQVLAMRLRFVSADQVLALVTERLILPAQSSSA